MNPSLALLEQAAQAILQRGVSKPPGDELVTALLDLEKQARYEKSSHCLRELVGNWRLCFITGTKKARNRAGIVLGAGKYLFPGNKRPRRKQRGIATLFLTFHAPQGAGNLPVILLKLKFVFKKPLKTRGKLKTSCKWERYVYPLRGQLNF
jgi:hypothetical protein